MITLKTCHLHTVWIFMHITCISMYIMYILIYIRVCVRACVSIIRVCSGLSARKRVCKRASAFAWEKMIGEKINPCLWGSPTPSSGEPLAIAFSDNGRFSRPPDWWCNAMRYSCMTTITSCPAWPSAWSCLAYHNDSFEVPVPCPLSLSLIMHTDLRLQWR